MTTLKHTPLHAQHEALDAHFTDFGGWDMPLRYANELAEHRAVREAAGLFDLSHMGEILVAGADAATFLNSALVGNLAVVKVGRAKYSLLCNEQGGIIDDLIVYRLSETSFLVVPNAGNAATVASELTARSKGFSVEVIDSSADTALVAVQGPASAEIVSAIVQADDRQAVEQLSYYAWVTVSIEIPVRAAAAQTDAEVAAHFGADVSLGQTIEVMLARTGYTGEDGFEIYLPNEHAAAVWQLALAVGEPLGLLPAGLASRDSLRLEAGMPLYGNELGLEVNPFEAGLGPVVSFKKDESFVGREALEAIKQQGSNRVLVGLRGEGRRAGRSDYRVFADGRDIGVITSGLPSPTLGYPIALAYIDPSFAEPGTAVEVDLRGKPQPFEVVALPFYSRDK